MQKNINKMERGRSMVEMLGVLAVIGVLSVGGIAGYKTAMTKHQANELLNEASKRAVVVAAKIAAGQFNASTALNEFGSEKVQGVSFTSSYTNGATTFDLTLTWDANSNKDSVCNQMKNIAGENGVPKIETNCDKITYNVDLSAGTSGGGSGEGEDNRPIWQKTGETPCETDDDCVYEMTCIEGVCSREAGSCHGGPACNEGEMCGKSKCVACPAPFNASSPSFCPDCMNGRNVSKADCDKCGGDFTGKLCIGKCPEGYIRSGNGIGTNEDMGCVKVEDVPKNICISNVSAESCQKMGTNYEYRGGLCCPKDFKCPNNTYLEIGGYCNTCSEIYEIIGRVWDSSSCTACGYTYDSKIGTCMTGEPELDECPGLRRYTEGGIPKCCSEDVEWDDDSDNFVCKAD